MARRAIMVVLDGVTYVIPSKTGMLEDCSGPWALEQRASLVVDNEGRVTKNCYGKKNLFTKSDVDRIEAVKNGMTRALGISNSMNVVDSAREIAERLERAEKENDSRNNTSDIIAEAMGLGSSESAVLEVGRLQGRLDALRLMAKAAFDTLATMDLKGVPKRVELQINYLREMFGCSVRADQSEQPVVVTAGVRDHEVLEVWRCDTCDLQFKDFDAPGLMCPKCNGPVSR